MFWIFPGLFVGGFLNRIRNFLEHADPDPNATPYITFKSNLIERLILSPFNFNFHAEHHIYPAIPYYNICKARILLKIQGIENQVNYSLSYYSRFLYLVRKLKIQSIISKTSN